MLRMKLFWKETIWSLFRKQVKKILKNEFIFFWGFFFYKIILFFSSLLAADIHQSCLVKNKDIRKFLDGIYVSEGGVMKGADE